MTDYTEIVKWLRNHSKSNADCDSCPYYDAEAMGYTTCSEELAEQAADAIEELTAFAHYVAKEVSDVDWEIISLAFQEFSSRKLYKLGIVEKDGQFWSYEPPKEET